PAARRLSAAQPRRGRARPGFRLRAVPDPARACRADRQHPVGGAAADGRDRPGADGDPSLLLLDEPSVGIAHRLKMEIFEAIRKIRENGTAILMAEQDAQSALRIADRVYVLEHGRVGREGTSVEMAKDDYIRQAYLGVSGRRSASLR